MSIVTLLRNTIKEFLEDECTSLASVISYSAFFSIFPLLMGMSAILSFFVQDPTTRSQVMNSVFSYLPTTGDFVRKTMEGAIEKRGQITFISALFLLVSGRAVFESTISAVGRAFETPDTRGFVQRLLLVFGIMFGVGGMLILSLVVTAVMNWLGHFSLFGFGPFQGSILWTIATGLVGIVFSFGMFLILYRLAPTQPFRFSELVPGALLAGFLFELAKQGFVIYVTQFSNYEEAYGPIGAVMALMMWSYFSALIMLLGAELSSEYAKLRRELEGTQLVMRVGPLIATPRPVPLTRRIIAPLGAALALVISFVAVLSLRRARPT
ncbi:MAG TPA: YihY/virulence factor BrkB family protein [Chloroflexota bacterium]|jgi:membrane protein|nr:YihY/virulence factor BrkB family protein [Chloroflexota bacterium]